jgi:hypothetical protein
MGHSNIDLAKGECAGVEQFSLVFTRNLEVCFLILFYHAINKHCPFRMKFP